MKQDEDEVDLIYDYLHDNYEYVDGELIRNNSKGSAKKGQTLGSFSYRGVGRSKMICMLYIKGKQFKRPLSNLIYLFHYKRYPFLTKFIDGNLTNCRIENLEEIFSKEVDCKGYSIKNNRGHCKYRVVIQAKNRKQISLGSYKTIEECRQIYQYARDLQKQGFDDEREIKQKVLEKFPYSKIRIEKKSFFKGVYKNRGTWLAKIQENGKQRYIGSYKTQEEAHAAYLKAKAEHA